MKNLSTGEDTLKWDCGGFDCYVNAEVTHTSYNYTKPGFYKSMSYKRKVLLSDVRKQKLSVMPGFNFSWYYSGIEMEPPKAKYYNDDKTKAFVRFNHNLQLQCSYFVQCTFNTMFSQIGKLAKA